MPLMQGFTRDDVNIIEQKTLYKGFFKMVEYTFKHRLFDGGWSDLVRRELFERGHAVAVLPYDPLTQEFVLVEQFRFGAMESAGSPWLIEIIAGMIDAGEAPEEVCVREAQEEAGIELSHLRKVHSYLSSPGGTSESLDIFVAKVDATTAHGVHGLPHESEDILVHRVHQKDAREYLANGKINNAAAIIALQWFFLHQDQLLKEWQLV